MARIDVYKDESIWCYILTLTAHETTIKFIPKNKADAFEWYNRLKSMSNVIALHFKHDFTLGKIISQSNHSKIRVALTTKNDKRYKVCVKSVYKSTLTCDERALVFFNLN